MKKKSQGETEAEFTRAMIQFEKSYLGRGPEDVRTFFLNDMIIVRLRGVLTPAEVKLSETRDGQELVKETRRRLFESSRPMLEQMVQDIVGCKVVSLHTDVSTRTGERVVVLTVDANLDNHYKTPKI
jgi:uncharacterized protein YbcI